MATEAKSASSSTTATSSSPYTVTPIPCLSDNYAYLIIAPSEDGKSRVAAVVDAVNPTNVLKAVKDAGLTNTDIVFALTTHHHADHAYDSLIHLCLFF
jgi:glyoxylase-like metal-dependent hydrolase (beta-lactamase superfamily II)